MHFSHSQFFPPVLFIVACEVFRLAVTSLWSPASLPIMTSGPWHQQGSFPLTTAAHWIFFSLWDSLNRRDGCDALKFPVGQPQHQQPRSPSSKSLPSSLCGSVVQISVSPLVPDMQRHPNYISHCPMVKIKTWVKNTKGRICSSLTIVINDTVSSSLCQRPLLLRRVLENTKQQK